MKIFEFKDINIDNEQITKVLISCILIALSENQMLFFSVADFEDTEP